MIGDRIRKLREAKAWTQAHLADASGVSLRTVQRLETLHSCSHETLLALASALDVDISELRNGCPAPAGPMLSSRWIVLAAILAAPAVGFVAANLLKYGGVWALPYDLAASVDSPVASTMLDSPLLLLGGPLVAISIVVATQLRLIGEWRGNSGVLLEVEVHPKASALLVAAAAGTAILTLVAYLIGENLA